MNDHDQLTRRLQNLGQRITPNNDPFRGVERRRHRRHVRRRATAAAVACLVAVGGLSLAAVAVVNGRQGTQPTSTTWTPPSVPTLWPELWTEPTAAATMADVQRRVDAGDPSVQWRTDPRAVVERFTKNVLGWTDWDPRVEAAPDRLGDVRFRVSCGRRCASVGPVTMFLNQPGRRGDGGIWSIGAVVDPSVDVAVSDAGPLQGVGMRATAGSSTARVIMTMRLGFAGRGGLELYNGCEIIQSSSPPIDRPGGSWNQVVPWFAAHPINCGGTTAAGYVFGFVKSAEMGVDTEGPFRQPHVLLYHLTALPVLVAEPDTTGSSGGPP
jgi:hypothetical protein